MRDANNYKTGDLYDYWGMEGGVHYDLRCSACKTASNPNNRGKYECTTEAPGRYCRGWSVRKSSPITQIRWYADNSLEVTLEDGTEHMALAPSGDACY